jgi:hypothetical protein
MIDAQSNISSISETVIFLSYMMEYIVPEYDIFSWQWQGTVPSQVVRHTLQQTETLIIIQF